MLRHATRKQSRLFTSVRHTGSQNWWFGISTNKVSSGAASTWYNQQLRCHSVDATLAGEKPFDKILIANRGEIACRVMHTCKRLGVKTVAVYSEADAESKHVHMADEAYCIGPAASKESYLRMDHILEVARRSGAQGIHPGYGFLSENAEFAEAVEAAGIKFIGPTGKSMDMMGDKIHSKQVATRAGCFVIPGFDGEIATAEEAVQRANEVGYPVMIKASAGGGGKGMRVAYSDAETREGFLLSKAEAASSFGDDRMLIERFIENPHHIEIQVVADTFGNVVAFPERECSVQRRNQKVVEESPSCMIQPATRRAMQEQAVQLCLATGYRSAGTVEMLADEAQNFYFLEMNTRLQVEHPVTEMVSGEDLVEHMLWVAADRPLPKRLTDAPYLQAKGSAIECRVYAEDPTRKFLPSIGPLVTYKEPAAFSLEADGTVGSSVIVGGGHVPEGVSVRVESGVYEGGTISMHYDPMISKLCTHASTRDAALDAMEHALDRYVVQGLGNNITFLRAICSNKKFRSGLYSTKFIGEEFPEGFPAAVSRALLSPREQNELVAVAAALHQAREEEFLDAERLKHHEMQQWEGRNAGAVGTVTAAGGEEEEEEELNMGPELYEEFVVLLNGPDPHAAKTPSSTAPVSTASGPVIEERAYLTQLSLDENSNLRVQITPLQGEKVDAAAGHRETEVVVIDDLKWRPPHPLIEVTFPPSAEGEADVDSAMREEVVQYLGRTASLEGYLLRYKGSEQAVRVRSVREHALYSHMLPPEVRDVSNLLLCPMPGTLISCNVKVGDRVEEGQEVAIVEAMKMQNVLRAEKQAVVKAVYKSAGSALKVDEVIIEFE